jgi:hypothetical protein
VTVAGPAVSAQPTARCHQPWVRHPGDSRRRSPHRRRRNADGQRSKGSSADHLGTRLTDAPVDALDSLRADLVQRREHLSAQEALSMFDQQMALSQLT